MDTKQETILDRHPATTIILNMLLLQRDLVTYQEMSEATGITVTGSCPYYQSARKAARNEHKVLYETARGVGARKIPDEENPDVAANSLKKANREFRRGTKRLACANIGKMSNTAKTRHSVTSAALGSLMQATRPRICKDIADGKVTQQAWLEGAENFVKLLKTS